MCSRLYPETLRLACLWGNGYIPPKSAATLDVLFCSVQMNRKTVCSLKGSVREEGTKHKREIPALEGVTWSTERAMCREVSCGLVSLMISSVTAADTQCVNCVSSQCTCASIPWTEATGTWRSALTLNSYVNPWAFGLQFWSLLIKTCRLMPGGGVHVFNLSLWGRGCRWTSASVRPARST